MKLKIKGFTFIEMIIILIIISVFVISILPRLSGIQGRARDVERKSNLQQIVAALTNYQLNNGRYIGGSGAVSIILQELVPVYIRTLPKDPYGDEITTIHGSQKVLGDYIYLSLETKKGYTLMSVSEGGGMHANRISNSLSTTLTGGYPGFINLNTKISTINKLLCSEVSNGEISRKGNVCTGILDKHEAKYIVARK